MCFLSGLLFILLILLLQGLLIIFVPQITVIWHHKIIRYIPFLNSVKNQNSPHFWPRGSVAPFSIPKRKRWEIKERMETKEANNSHLTQKNWYIIWLKLSNKGNRELSRCMKSGKLPISKEIFTGQWPKSVGETQNVLSRLHLSCVYFCWPQIYP